jgi:hypothetical protein
MNGSLVSNSFIKARRLFIDLSFGKLNERKS